MRGNERAEDTEDGTLPSSAEGERRHTSSVVKTEEGNTQKVKNSVEEEDIFITAATAERPAPFVEVAQPAPGWPQGSAGRRLRAGNRSAAKAQRYGTRAHASTRMLAQVHMKAQPRLLAVMAREEAVTQPFSVRVVPSATKTPTLVQQR